MKKTLLSLFALATAAVASAQETEVASVTFQKNDDGTFVANAVNATFEDGGASIEEKSSYVVLKVGSSDNIVKVTPTGGLKAGDVITVTGFVSSGKIEKSATLKISYDDSESYSWVTGYDEATFKGFPDLKEGGYNPGTEPGTAVYVVENDATSFSLKRNSAGSTGGATSAFVTSIVITRSAASGETPETPVEPDVTPINDIQIEAQVVAVEYFTLAGAKVDEPVKGINIVKTYYSNNTTTTTTLVK